MVVMIVDSDITGLNLNVTTGHSLVKNLDINNGLKVIGITTISGYVAIGASFTAGRRLMDILHLRGKFGINVDRNNKVAIGTDAPFNDVGLVNDLRCKTW